MSEENVGALSSPKIRMGDTSKTPRVYSNNVQVTASNWDFTFFFGEMVAQLGAEGSADTECVSKAVVVMSPEHAKAFLQAVQTTVARYEKLVTAVREKAKTAAVD